jgi:hypothetical protein
MAARRLLAVLIALLIVSSLAAALAPQRQSEEDSDSTTTTTESPAAATGAVLVKRIAADPPEPARIEATAGDQLQLTVAASEPATVTVPGLGLTSFAAPSDPVRFDLLLRTEGRFPITVGAAEPAEVGVIVVGEESRGDAPEE